MKLILIGLLALGSISSYAGKVVRNNGSQELISSCRTYGPENACQEYEITLSDNLTNETKVVARYAIHHLINPSDEFALRENIERFNAFPITKWAYGANGTGGAFDYDVMDFAGYGAAGGLGLVVLGAIAGEATIGILGAGFIGAAIVVVTSPMVADVVSMPVRAIIRGIRIRSANRAELTASNALRTLILETEESEMHLNKNQFNQVLKAFATL